MRTLFLGLLFLIAACGGKEPAANAQGRPDDVAKAVFEALKAGGLGPLEPHLMTGAESKSLTTLDLDDSELRERWDRLIAQHHERMNVDWESAVAGTAKVKYDPMGQGALVTLPIKSDRGTVTVQVNVTKVGRRYVFDDLKLGAGSEEKQAAPAEDGEEDDGCGC